MVTLNVVKAGALRKVCTTLIKGGCWRQTVEMKCNTSTAKLLHMLPQALQLYLSNNYYKMKIAIYLNVLLYYI